ADKRGFEIAGIGHFGFKTEIIPRGSLKDALLLHLIHGRVGVDPVRHSADALFWPRVLRPFCLRHTLHTHVSYSDTLLSGCAGIPPEVISPSQRCVKST